MALIKILKLDNWNIAEKVRAPLRDADGNHIVFTDPYTQRSEPQYEERAYQVGDTIDLADPWPQLAAGNAVLVDNDGKEINPVGELTIGNHSVTNARAFAEAVKKETKGEPLNVVAKNKIDQSTADITQSSFISVMGELERRGFDSRIKHFADENGLYFLRATKERVTQFIKDIVNEAVDKEIGSYKNKGYQKQDL